MNILFFESSIDPYRGGIQRVTDLLYHYFEKNGINCFFVFYLVDNKEIPLSQKMKIKIDDNKRKNVSNYISFIKEKKIDIIINQDQYHKFLLDAYSIIKKDNLCKIINCFHLSPDFFDFYPLSFKGKIKYWVYRILLNKDIRYGAYKVMYQVCDKFVLLSKTFEANFLKEIKLEDNSKLCFISNPLSFQLDKPVEIENKEKIVLIISRYHETQKNLCAAMRIWKQVENRINSDWKLALGGYGPDEQMLMNYIKQLNIKNIKILGKVKESLPYYEKASIFMMTSNFEGFGMTLTEAMQNGCVPMAFDTYTALHDIITNKVDGIIVPAKDEKRYANELLKLMLNEDYRKTMALNAMNNSEKFSIDTIGGHWQQVFNDLLNIKNE
ncbi:MAG: glycosyltransferase [Holdemanella biformis]|nr:glycosyltransferase [Holdemanella biformis]